MRNQTYKMVYTGIFAVLLAICSWISIPTVIPFTLQTFGVFLTILLLGGKQGTTTILIYLLLGCVGIPVFSNFGAGAGYLLGSSGGYALGFLLISLCSWIFETSFGKHGYLQLFSLILGLLCCYAFGTCWFCIVSFGSQGNYNLLNVLSLCVFPFILPDLLKLLFAYIISKRLKSMLY